MKTGIKSKRNVTLVKAKLYDLIATGMFVSNNLP